jgi:arylsulfatase A
MRCRPRLQKTVVVAILLATVTTTTQNVANATDTSRDDRASQGVAAARPNIVVILADDLGYGELGCYGQEKIKTPNIDRLAADGMRFLQHYTGAPVCAPARCVLLTGQHLSRAEIRGNRDSGNGRIFPGQWPLTAEVETLAEVLQAAGYATGGFGKWGLGPSNTSGSPIKQGFDRFFGYNCQRNAHSYYPPFLDSNEREIALNKYPIPGHDRKPTGIVTASDYRSAVYAPDKILEEAVTFLEKNKARPFFLYLPFVEPHVAMQPPQEWLDRYPEVWDAEHGPYRGQNGYLPHPRPRAAYASMISDLDEHVGVVLKRLDDLALADNTVVVFTSDNGPTHGGSDPRFHIGGAGCTFFKSTGGLRGFKGSCYEGGIRVPCIVKWPKKVPPGTTTSAASSFADWFPTLAQIAHASLETPQPLDGINLDSVLAGGEPATREVPLSWDFHDYGGIVAIRRENWKAIRRNVNRAKPTPWELYDIEADPGETNDRAATNPEKVKALATLFENTRTREPDFPSKLYDHKRDQLGAD